jgi:protein-S-isoprenylcysteine O-methyltransferase Ste14
VAIQFEESDLEDIHPEYADYKERTPMLIPRLGDDDAAARQPAD